MKPWVAKHIESIVPYRPGKPIAELQREYGIACPVKLASNENPLGPSPRVLDAIRGAMGDLHRYPDGAAYELVHRLAEFLGVPSRHILVGAGSNEILDLLFRTFLAHDDNVVIGKPSFVYYPIGLQAANVRYREVPLRNHLEWSVDDLLGAVDARTKMIVIANPNNPTATTLNRSELQRLLGEVPDDVIVVLDEAYAEYAEPDAWGSGLELRDLHERLVVLRTFSKAYGLAGLRVGYAVAPAAMVDYLHRVRLPFNTSSLAQAAAIAALQDPEHLARVVSFNRGERQRVQRLLNEAGFDVVPSQANFFLVRTQGSVANAAELYEALLRKGVIVRPVPAPLDSYLRVTIGSAEENDRFVRAILECSPAS